MSFVHCANLSKIAPVVILKYYFCEAIIAHFLTFFIFQGRNPLFMKKGSNFRNCDILTKQRHIICSETILVEIRGVQDVSKMCHFFAIPDAYP